MATGDYAILSDLHTYAGVSDTQHDALLAACITDASRLVDAWTKRPDLAFVAQTQTRVFDVPSRLMTLTPYTRDVTLANAQATGWWSGGTVATLNVGWPVGLLSVTSLATDANYDGIFETTWTQGSDFDLLPINAALDNQPYRTVRVLPTGKNQLPIGARTLQVIGSWGEYATTPAAIQHATLRTASRLFALRKAPTGMTEDAGAGSVKIQPDLLTQQILCEGGFVKWWRVV